MGANIYYLELIFTSVNILQQQKLMKKDILTEILFLKKKKKRKSTRKKIGCKFIRINTSNAKNDYNLDCKIVNIETFIDELKNKKIKEEKEIREKLEMRNKKLEMRTKKLEMRNKKLRN